MPRTPISARGPKGQVEYWLTQGLLWKTVCIIIFWHISSNNVLKTYSCFNLPSIDKKIIVLILPLIASTVNTFWKKKCFWRTLIDFKNEMRFFLHKYYLKHCLLFNIITSHIFFQKHDVSKYREHVHFFKSMSVCRVVLVFYRTLLWTTLIFFPLDN